MAQLKITVSVPHLQKEFDVTLTDSISGKRLYEALIKQINNQANGTSISSDTVFELYVKNSGEKVYPDKADNTLSQIGLKSGDTVILKKDMDPGA